MSISSDGRLLDQRNRHGLRFAMTDGVGDAFLDVDRPSVDRLAV
ncbi:MAG: hypothetical protein R3D30_09985 [Hyphomicrobiales bacterium]